MRCTLLAAAVLALPLSTLAQKTSRSRAKVGRGGQVKSITSDNLVGYDDRALHLGLYVAPNFSRYLIEQAPGYPRQEHVSANSIISPGFSVGFLGDLRLGNYGALTFAPGVSFLTRRIEFKDQGYVQNAVQYPNDPEKIEDQEIGSTQVDFPIMFKLKSERRRNTRVYLIAGVKPSLNIGGSRKNPDVNLLQAADSDFAIEYGVGLDLFYPFFKFSPELRFSNGLKNLYVPSTNDVYSRSLQSMKSNTVTLYLNIWSGR
ncbi:type IX secretion/gliding motility protein PorT/SprT [Hymenobacter actinosclerus]|uniref:Probable protein-translocating porin PorT n=1 Tax=Hymenobacter actinosclerus TaxID=82805 RepID=A0A1I0DGQ6_9BACT|nr:porin family protein [Hymenobacter actinosclerus]SET30818.1 probable protein-translocating porin PorT [Hymenobacter actinosclerus]